jgi:hypothetical protein
MPRWSKGRSGNPRGRTKRGQAFSDALRARSPPDELAELAWEYGIRLNIENICGHYGAF